MMAGAIEASGDLAAEVQQLRERMMLLEDRLAPGGEHAQKVPFFMMAYAWVDRVAGVVGEEWGCSAAELKGGSRLAVIVRPRFVLVWLLREAAGYSMPLIARLVGYDDHTSVVHALRRVDGWRKADETFRYITDQMLVIARRLYAESRPVRPVAADEVAP